MLKICSSDIMFSVSISSYLSSIFNINNSEYILEFKLVNVYTALKIFNIEISKILNINDIFINTLNNILLENIITKILFNFDLLYNNNNDVPLLISDILDDIAFSIPMDQEDIIPVYNLLNKFITRVYEEEKYVISNVVNNLLKEFNSAIFETLFSIILYFSISFHSLLILLLSFASAFISSLSICLRCLSRNCSSVSRGGPLYPYIIKYS